ncbi:MAG: pre-peptidase C-terminal domain-containing protein [Magnetococcales bacterium]|nr:pre-peptidase C-terminal domain-containing protein [Magnetococcales bacterium]
MIMAATVKDVGNTIKTASGALNKDEVAVKEGVGTSIATNVIDKAGDTDWFRVNLAANTTYYFAMTSNDAVSTLGKLNANLSLANATGGIFKSNNNFDGKGNAFIEYRTGAAKETVYMVAAGTSGTKGGYSLNVATDAPEVAFQTTGLRSIAATTQTGSDFNGDASGYADLISLATGATISKRGDRDVYAVALEAGKEYQFDMTRAGAAADKLNPYLRVLGTDGVTVLKANNDAKVNTVNASVAKFTVAQDGVYFVEASGASNTFNNAGGNYNLNVQLTGTGFAADVGNTIATASTILVGSRFTAADGSKSDANVAKLGSLDTDTDVDCYKTTLDTNKIYKVTLTPVAGIDGSAAPDAVMVLRDQNGADITGSSVSVVGTQDELVAVGERTMFFSPTTAASYVAVSSLANYTMESHDIDGNAYDTTGLFVEHLDATAVTETVVTQKTGLYRLTIVEDSNRSGQVVKSISLDAANAASDLAQSISAKGEVDWYRVVLSGGSGGAGLDYTFTATGTDNVSSPKSTVGTAVDDAGTSVSTMDVKVYKNGAMAAALDPTLVHLNDGESGVYLVRIANGGADLSTGLRVDNTYKTGKYDFAITSA